ncbi:hypothetical protein V6N13_137498 [Hibiscus sabdariffa]|uniref:Uncharacterized protein n=1 Tax=Hibiscus sabdariffa TaxID=183260 RepID=A0ABR2DKG8_9ROSI
MRIPVGGEKHSCRCSHRRSNVDQERPPQPPYLLHPHECAPPSLQHSQPVVFGGTHPTAPPPPYFQHPVFFGQTALPSSYFQHPLFLGPTPAGTPHYQPAHFPAIIIPASVCSCAHQSNPITPRVEPFHLTPHLVSEQKPTVKVYCKADPSYNLTIRNGRVVLSPSDPYDCFQHWYKDETFSPSVNDEQGFPGFSLVNKATGEAIKHAIGTSELVQLVPFTPGHLDESVLWSESKEIRDGYKAIRRANNIRMNLDAFLGERNGSIFKGYAPKMVAAVDLSHQLICTLCYLHRAVLFVFLFHWPR